ncbi:hypothetical protein Tco_1421718 [Tanacetum coccineum]
MSYNEIMPNFEKFYDFNQHIKPMDSEHGSERIGQKKSAEKFEKDVVDAEKEKEEEKTEQVVKEVLRESGAKRKKSIPRKSTRGTVKRQKVEEDVEKEDLKGYLDIIPREDVVVDVDSLSTKGDGSSKNYKGDLHTLFEPDEDNEIWKNQHEYNVIKKKYPLSQEMLSKMLSKRLEVDHESSQAFELLRRKDDTADTAAWRLHEDKDGRR